MLRTKFHLKQRMEIFLYKTIINRRKYKRAHLKLFLTCVYGVGDIRQTKQVIEIKIVRLILCNFKAKKK